VAATEFRTRRARGRRTLKLPPLPWFIAGFGALLGRPVQAQSSVDFKWLYYQESDGRTQVLNPMLSLHQDLGFTLGILDLVLSHDTISGASPSGGYPTLSVTTSASGTTNSSGKVPLTPYSDHRQFESLKWGRRFGAHLPSVELSYAVEKDYTSREFGLSDAWTMAEGRGTLHYGFSVTNDTVAPVTTTLKTSKQEHSYALGWTWVLGEDDLVDASASVSRVQGKLDDPYKIVPVGTATLPDHRPDSRARDAFLIKHAHYFSWEGALKSTYRYYRDDWSVRAHTLDFIYDQRLDEGWMLSPRLRYYTQSRAAFYAGSFASPEPFMSSDYRLSAFGNLLGGLTVSTEIRPGLTLSLGGTYQFQHGRDRLIPIASAATSTRPAVLDGPSTSAADLDTTTITVGITWRY
jgi:hypothetical protein